MSVSSLGVGYEADNDNDNDDDNDTDFSAEEDTRLCLCLMSPSLLKLAARKRKRKSKISSSSSVSTSSVSSNSTSTSSSESSLTGDSSTTSSSDSRSKISNLVSQVQVQGQTSCRHHGQYPRRHRNYPYRYPYSHQDQQDQEQQQQQDQTQMGQKRPRLFRKGVVKGTATNLNDYQYESQSTNHKEKTTQKVVFQLLPQIHTWNPSPTLSSIPLSQSTASSSSTPAPNAVHPPIHQRLPYLLSPQPCTIEEALSFSPHARLLLEPVAPYRVVHHNAAYGAFLQRQKGPLHSTTVGMEYDELNTAVEDLFAGQLVVLHPVRGSSPKEILVYHNAFKNRNFRYTQKLTTYYLLELGPSGPIPSNNTSIHTGAGAVMDCDSEKNHISGSHSHNELAIPAQAIG